MATEPFSIRAEWDDESQVWVATSDDVPGLVAASQEVPFELLSRRFEIARQVTG